MYLNFFHLDEIPFNLTPDPRFFFMSRNHLEAVEHLEFGIQQRKGFVVITGEVGSGKTTVCRALLSRLDGTKTETALILNPMLSPLELLQAINEDLGLEYEDNSRKRLTKILNKFLLAQFERGGNVAVIVDEAQKLSEDALEQIRLLSNLETAKDKLIQIVLLGQPELASVLSRPSMTPLAQRIAVRYHLGPLDFERTCQYVAHRLRVAGCHQSVFTKGALRAVFRYSGGIPRKINLVCDKALLCAFGMGELQGQKVHVRSALAELGQHRSGFSGAVRRLSSRKWAIVAVVLAILSTWYVSARWFAPRPGGSPIPNAAVVDNRGLSSAAKSGSSAHRVSEPTSRVEPGRPSRGMSGFDRDGAYRVESGELAPFGAVITLLRLWHENLNGVLANGDASSISSAAEVWKLIDHAGYRIESRRTTLSRVKLLDVPCLIMLRKQAQGPATYCALCGFNDGTFQVADPTSGLLRLVETDLDKRWTQRAIYVLPDIAGLRYTLRLGKRGPDVMGFRARLFNLGLLGDSRSDRYDAECAEAVKRFQLLSGLIPDGIAGWRTRIALVRDTFGSQAPRLSTWPPGNVGVGG
ncbi:MAG TPA: AAA family ATPase [bacterium]|nr:AAA family ATPase [bacterium]